MPKKKIRVAFCMRDMQMGGAKAVLVRTLEQLIKRDDLDVSFVSYVKITEPVYAQWFANHPQVKQYVLYPCPWLGTKLKRFFLLRIGQHFLRDIYRWGRRIMFNKRVWNNFDVVVDYYDFGFYQELKNVNVRKIAWWHSSINKFISGANKYIKFLKKYNQFVVLTDGFMTEFKEKWPQCKNKIVRIYNPMDIGVIQKRAIDAMRELDNDYFICVARLSGDKDIETVLRAFDIFWQNNNCPDVNMVFVGGGDLNKYRALADKFGVRDKIIFMGAQKNPFGFMKYSMAHVLSSHSEGLPTVLLETMAVEVLNIASDCKNGPREILLDGDAGLLFQPGNADDLAAHMENVWKNKVPIKKMKKAATKSCDRFSIQNVIPDVVKVIKHQRA